LLKTAIVEITVAVYARIVDCVEALLFMFSPGTMGRGCFDIAWAECFLLHGFLGARIGILVGVGVVTD